MNTFLVGVNYWPRRKAMYWWKDFDDQEVKEEFREIRDLNLRIVRIFLVWEDFQPNPHEINRSSLENLRIVLDLAHKYGLKVIPTFFCGFMSGINWIPSWALSMESISSKYSSISNGKVHYYSIKNIYEDPFMLEAQLFQIRTIVASLHNHPAIFAWDLSNEVSNLSTPRTSQLAKDWCQKMNQEIKKIDVIHPVTLGLHQEDLEQDRGFHPYSISLAIDFLSMHGYSIYAKWARTPLDSDVVPFLNVLTESLGQKPVLFEEFGVATAPLDEPSKTVDIRRFSNFLSDEYEAAQYYQEVLKKLHQVGSLGALAWCFSDYDESLWRKPPLNEYVWERYFGITRNDKSLKPTGKVLKDFIFHERKIATSSLHKLDVSVENYYSDPLKNLNVQWASFRTKILHVT